MFLKPELVDAFEKLHMTYELKIFRRWHQGQPDGLFLGLPNEKKKQNQEGKTTKTVKLCSHNYPSVKVIQIPLPTKREMVYPNPKPQQSRNGLGVIDVDGRYIVYLLRKEEALALERIVLEFERSQCITSLGQMVLEFTRKSNYLCRK